MQRIKQILYDSPSFKGFRIPELSEGPLHTTGLTGSLKSVFLAYLSEILGYRVIYISASDDQAEQIRDDLELLTDRGHTVFYPSVEITPYEDREPNPSLSD